MPELDLNFLFFQAIEAGKAFYSSGFFTAVKIFLIIYSLVILADLIFLLFLRNLGEDLRKTLKGWSATIESKEKSQKKWDEIVKKIDSDNPSQYKAAILEADWIVNNILEKAGYKDKTLGEKLENIKAVQLENVNDLKEAHRVATRIVYEKDFFLEKEEAKKNLAVYEEVLKSLDYL